MIHVFFRRQLPNGITPRERTLLIGKLVYYVPHGNGFGCPTYCLSDRGREILMELGKETKRKEVMA